MQIPKRTISRIARIYPSRIFLLLAACVLGLAPAAPAAIWINNSPTGDWNAGANWSPAVVPTAPDSAIFTNAITGNRVTTNSLVAVTIQDLVISNTTLFTRTLLIPTNHTLAVNGTALLGSNAVLQFVTAISPTVGTSPTGIVNNLTMESNGSVVFRRTGGSLMDSLIVTGQFSNTAENLISSSGGSWQLILSNNQEFVNAGTIEGGRFLGGGPTRSITVATATQTNTFRNTGTILFGIGGTAATRVFSFNSYLVNQGFLSLSNNTTANGGSLTMNIVGGPNSAVTNDSTGTIRLVGFNGQSGENIVRALEGGFVNKGIISSRIEPTVGVRTNSITVVSAGQTFSNAVGGQIIVDSGNANGVLAIRADRIINLGTNVIQSGTLTLQNSTGGANVYTNAGVVRLEGGNLVVSNLFTTSSGVLSGNGTIRTTNTVSAGLLSPGITLGMITNVGNYTMLGAHVSDIEIGTNAFGPGVGWDELLVVGNLTLTGRLDVTLMNDFLPGLSDSFLIMTNSGTIVGNAFSFTNVFNQAGTPLVNAYDTNGMLLGSMRVNVDAKNVILDNFVAAELVVIPEPSILLLLGAGLIVTWKAAGARRQPSRHTVS